jgi:uncharacterized iron-regulated membrane protein
MNWSAWIRQIHRWLAIAFTIGVIANFAVLGQQPYPLWAGVMALLPLSLLLITGLYMFFLPYAAAWREKRRAGIGKRRTA